MTTSNCSACHSGDLVNATGGHTCRPAEPTTPRHDPGRLGFKIRPKRGGPWLHVDKLAELDRALEGGNGGDEYELVATWMTQAERDALGEFEGW